MHKNALVKLTQKLPLNNVTEYVNKFQIQVYFNFYCSLSSINFIISPRFFKVNCFSCSPLYIFIPQQIKNMFN